jgi:putative nucleotidyltransferase with HDIG domain
MAIPERLVEGIRQLKPLPVTAQRLASALQADEIAPNKIAEIVQYDVAVAANILRVANSAAYAGRFRIDCVRDAVVRLGTTTLLEIVLGEHLKALKAPAPIYDLTEDDLWLHGAAASLAVKAMKHEVPAGRIPPEASIAALVHDIGKLIMVRFLSADVGQIRILCQRKNLTFPEAERDLFGCDHCEVGAAIARKWSFPDAITRAISRHHTVPIVEPDAMLDAVMLANLAAMSVGVGLGCAGLNFKVDYSGSRERLGMTMEGFERACAQTAIWVCDVRISEGIPDSRPLSAVGPCIGHSPTGPDI